jgi:two-component system response regulator
MPMKPYVLVVDGDGEAAERTRRALGDHRVANDVVTLKDGGEATEFLFGASRSREELPVLILLASGLPVLSGLDVYERIARDPATRGIPTIILTSGKPEEDVLEGRFPGRGGYVRKPIDFVEFLQAARTAGLQWLLVREEETR